MPEPGPTTADLRELALRALWRALGREPAQTKTVVEFPAGLTQYLDVAGMLPESPLAQETMEIDLTDVAASVRTIWSVSGENFSEWKEAFDLGDDFYYVAYTLTEVEHGTLQTAVPKKLAKREFAAMESELFDAQVLIRDFGYHPTAVYGIDLSAPQSLRAITSALNRPGFARHVVEEVYGVPWPSDEAIKGERWAVRSTKALRELWKTAVRCDPPFHRLPPGFTSLAERSEKFEKWLGRAKVNWADTGKLLDTIAANALRLTCLFLAKGLRVG